MEGSRMGAAWVCVLHHAYHGQKTGKVKEIVYQRDHAAEEKMRRLMRTPDIEVTVCNHDSIHHIIMKSTDELEDEDD